MRDGDRAESGRLFGKLYRTGKFRCYIHNAEQSLGSFIEMMERAEIRVSQICAVLRALFLFREKGAFHLDTHETGTIRRLLVFESDSCFVCCFQHIIGQRHGRGSKAGHAIFCKIACHFDEAGIIAV